MLFNNCSKVSYAFLFVLCVYFCSRSHNKILVTRTANLNEMDFLIRMLYEDCWRLFIYLMSVSRFTALYLGIDIWCAVCMYFILLLFMCILMFFNCLGCGLSTFYQMKIDICRQGPFPVQFWHWSQIEFNMQLCLSGLKDVDRCAVLLLSNDISFVYAVLLNWSFRVINIIEIGM